MIFGTHMKKLETGIVRLRTCRCTHMFSANRRKHARTHCHKRTSHQCRPDSGSIRDGARWPDIKSHPLWYARMSANTTSLTTSLVSLTHDTHPLQEHLLKLSSCLKTRHPKWSRSSGHCLRSLVRLRIPASAAFCRCVPILRKRFDALAQATLRCKSLCTT